MDVGPFQMTPNAIELDKGQSVKFDLVYTPSGIGEQRERFVMVCDNCLVRVFQLVGRGCQVDIAATQVNDSPSTPPLPRWVLLIDYFSVMKCW